MLVRAKSLYGNTRLRLDHFSEVRRWTYIATTMHPVKTQHLFRKGKRTGEGFTNIQGSESVVEIGLDLCHGERLQARLGMRENLVFFWSYYKHMQQEIRCRCGSQLLPKRAEGASKGRSKVGTSTKMHAIHASASPSTIIPRLMC